MVSYTYPIAFLFWFGCVNALVPLSTFSQSQRRRLNNDAKNSRKLLPWQFIPLLHVYFLRQSLTPWATGWGAAAKPVSASIADIWTRPNWNSPCIDASDSSLGCTNKINQNSCEVFKFWTRFDISRLAQPLLFSLVGASIVVSWPHSCRWFAMFHSFLLFVSCTTWLKAPMFSLNYFFKFNWMDDLITRSCWIFSPNRILAHPNC